MAKRLAVIVAAIALLIGSLVSAPAASAATSYQWSHIYGPAGGATQQSSNAGFSRLSYYHGTSCHEVKLVIQSDGNIVVYWRHSDVGSCGAWSVRWASNTEGHPNSIVYWHSDENWVERDQYGNVIFASGTSHPGSGTQEAMILQYNGYLILQHGATIERTYG